MLVGRYPTTIGYERKWVKTKFYDCLPPNADFSTQAGQIVDITLLSEWCAKASTEVWVY